MPISSRAKIIANPCSPAAVNHNWNALAYFFGKVRTNENHELPVDLIDTVPHTPTMKNTLQSDHTIDVEINTNPRPPGAGQDDQLMVWNHADQRFDFYPVDTIPGLVTQTVLTGASVSGTSLVFTRSILTVPKKEATSDLTLTGADCECS